MQRRQSTGFTLIEMMVATFVIAVMVMLGYMGMQSWLRNQRSKEIARQFADLLMVSRAEAVRSGDTMVVFFNADKGGSTLTNAGGNSVAALSIRDADGDGVIDAGEHFADVHYPPPGSLSWGYSMAADRASGDPGGSPGSPPAAPLTFSQPDSSAATWVAFQPDGTPRAYVDGSLAGTGPIGSGAGAIYVTSGDRDYAIVLTPLGTVQVQIWDPGSSQWRR